MRRPHKTNMTDNTVPKVFRLGTIPTFNEFKYFILERSSFTIASIN